MNAKAVIVSGAIILGCGLLILLAELLIPKPRPKPWNPTTAKPPTTTTTAPRHAPSVLVTVNRLNHSNLSISIVQQGSPVKLLGITTRDIDFNFGTILLDFDVACSDGYDTEPKSAEDILRFIDELADDIIAYHRSILSGTRYGS
ncbi:hypothetical protein Ddc_21367 [Ditylenchus destructor]|nr:hypothetical protein Ddc_21367 [Ditylenchus destructor]